MVNLMEPVHLGVLHSQTSPHKCIGICISLVILCIPHILNSQEQGRLCKKGWVLAFSIGTSFSLIFRQNDKEEKNDKIHIYAQHMA